MLRELFTSCATLAKETFSDQSETFENVKRHSVGDAFLTLVIVALFLFVILVFGKYLWNKVGCKYITVLKPVPSVVELLALVVLLDLVLPSCNCMVRTN